MLSIIIIFHKLLSLVNYKYQTFLWWTVLNLRVALVCVDDYFNLFDYRDTICLIQPLEIRSIRTRGPGKLFENDTSRKMAVADHVVQSKIVRKQFFLFMCIGTRCSVVCDNLLLPRFKIIYSDYYLGTAHSNSTSVLCNTDLLILLSLSTMCNSHGLRDITLAIMPQKIIKKLSCVQACFWEPYWWTFRSFFFFLFCPVSQLRCRLLTIFRPDGLYIGGSIDSVTLPLILRPPLRIVLRVPLDVLYNYSHSRESFSAFKIDRSENVVDGRSDFPLVAYRPSL